MSGDVSTVVVGNLTAAPTLNFTQSGVAVVSFTVAATPRVFDRQANDWRDGDTTFLRCNAWRDLAENIAALDKGTRVIASGKLKQRSYETKDGGKRSSFELEVDELGVSVRFGARGSGSGGAGNSEPAGSWVAAEVPDDTPF